MTAEEFGIAVVLSDRRSWKMTNCCEHPVSMPRTGVSSLIPSCGCWIGLVHASRLRCRDWMVWQLQDPAQVDALSIENLPPGCVVPATGVVVMFPGSPMTRQREQPAAVLKVCSGWSNAARGRVQRWLENWQEHRLTELRCQKIRLFVSK
jgi:hypothetical protein